MNKKTFTLDTTNFVRTPRLLRFAGFTLAEVLITIGIIGVVAALTIPILSANTKSHQFRSQFKKTLSVFNQGVRMNKANYDWDFSDLSDTCYLGDKTNSDNPETKKSICALLNGNIKGSYTRIEVYENNESGKETSEHWKSYNVFDEAHFVKSSAFGDITNFSFWIYALPDGAYLGLLGNRSSCSLDIGVSKSSQISNYVTSKNCIGIIDVNGRSGPNKEIACSNGETSFDLDKPCIIKNSDITDVYPVVLYNSTVAPATNAAEYVLNTTK
ncbi:type II secretion system protein [bacterium]|nr:type II secretion system protein [bacterium]